MVATYTRLGGIVIVAALVGCGKDNPDYGDTGASSGSSTSTSTSTSTFTTTTTTTATMTTTTTSSSSSSSGSGTGPARLGWEHTITIGALQGAVDEVLSDVPVMVRLTPETFAYEDAAANGAGIRFRDAQGNLLAHEVETWDPQRASIIWVRVPEVDTSVSTSLTLSYGFQSPPATVNAAEVWSNGYVAVFHFADAVVQPQPFADSTLNGNDAELNAADPFTVSPWGRALSLEQTQQPGVVHNATHDLQDLTLSAWVRPQVVSQLNSVHREIIDKPGAYRLIAVNFNNPGGPTLNLTNDANQDANAPGTDPLVVGTWTHVLGTYNGAQLRLFVNGESAGEVDNPIVPAFQIGQLRIGSDYVGDMDEVRVAALGRSPTWVEFQYASMDDTLLTFEAAQPVFE